MKSILFMLAAVVCVVHAAAQCQPEGRYRDFIFPGWEKTADIIYGQNTNYQGNNEVLKMDVYVPQGDAANDRALVIICHGGFFLYGDKAEADVVPFCQDLARMGYVVASINYRLGLEFVLPLNEPYGRTLLRAVQDLKAAIRWFRKDVAEGANQFGIDTNEIYTGGVSAGGFMALHNAYMQEEELPAFVDLNGIGLSGSFEGTSGNPGFSTEVKAIFNIAGAIGDTAWIDASDQVPACLFHGTNDQTVPFGSDMFYLFGLVEVTELDGSNSINQRLDEVGIEHCFEVNEGLGHVPHLGNPAVYDTTLSIISNFLSHYICGVELDCSYREILTSINEISSVEELELWPNPARDFIQWHTSKPVNQIVLRDVAGRAVYAFQVPGNSSRMTLPPGFCKGIYLLEAVLDDGSVLSEKLIIE